MVSSVVYRHVKAFYEFSHDSMRFVTFSQDEPFQYTGDLLNYALMWNSSTIKIAEPFRSGEDYSEAAKKNLTDVLAYPSAFSNLDPSLWSSSHPWVETRYRIVSGKEMGYVSDIWAVFHLIDLLVLIVEVCILVFGSLLSHISEKMYFERNCAIKGQNPNSNNSIVQLQLKIIGMIMIFKPSCKLPQSSGSRILIGSILFSSLVMMSYLASQFITVVTFIGKPKRIETMSDILKYSDIRPLIPGFFEKLFLTSGSQDMILVWRKAEELKSICGFLEQYEELDTNVAEGKAVLFFDQFYSAYRISRSTKTGFFISPVDYGNMFRFYSIRSSLPHTTKDIINKRHLVFQEGGFYPMAYSFIHRKIGRFLFGVDFKTVTLEIIHLVPALFFYSIGCSVAIASFLIECICANWTVMNKKIRKVSPILNPS